MLLSLMYVAITSTSTKHLVLYAEKAAPTLPLHNSPVKLKFDQACQGTSTSLYLRDARMAPPIGSAD
jgi:hypothetical protein